MSHDVVVRFSDEEAAALRAHKKSTDLPTSAFIRRAVRNELRRPIIDAETEAPIVPAVVAEQVRAVNVPQENVADAGERRMSSAAPVLVLR
jgi:hypothetical protein